MNKQVTAAQAQELLCGMYQLCEGMSTGVFDLNIDGVLHRHKQFTEDQNGTDWVKEYYDIVAGMFRMMAAATDIITVSLINGDLDIIDGKE